MNIFVIERQGDLQDEYISSNIYDTLLVSATSLILMFLSSSPLALSSSMNIESNNSYTEVVIIIYEDEFNYISYFS